MKLEQEACHLYRCIPAPSALQGREPELSAGVRDCWTGGGVDGERKRWRDGVVDRGRDLWIHGCISGPSLARNPGSPLAAFYRACIWRIFGLAL